MGVLSSKHVDTWLALMELLLTRQRPDIGCRRLYVRPSFVRYPTLSHISVSRSSVVNKSADQCYQLATVALSWQHLWCDAKVEKLRHPYRESTVAGQLCIAVAIFLF